MTRNRPTTTLRDLTLQTLGAVALRAREGDGAPVLVLGPGKPLALITYLAFSPGRAANREHLIDLLWSDLEPERSKHALRQTIYFIRSQLGDQVLAGRPGELALGAPIVTDRDLFLDAVEEGSLERATELYTGSFLPGFASPGGAEFEHWADLERERLRGIFVRTAESLARRHLGTSSFRDAQRLARRARDEDPLNEGTWRLLIESLIAGGDQLAAAIEADALTTLLQSEGRSAEPATRNAMRLARQRSDPLQTDAQPRGLETELVGREAEFAGIIRAWEAARAGKPRHVHVSAPAGLGKTRLLNDVYGRLRASGALVVNLRANPGDRRIAYLLAGELARALGTLPGAAAVSPAAASALVALHPGLSSQFAAPMDTSSGDEALRRRTMALSELVAAVADEAPFALLIDDIHWSDPASTQMLLGVLERLGGARLLVVTTARTAREDLVAASASHRLLLEPLTVGQVGALLVGLGALPDEDWTDAFIAALHATTGGSPLLVLETLQLALERKSLVLHDGRWSCADPVFLITEFQAGGALRHRIAQLDSESRELLVLLATAGAPLPIARVSRAAGQPVEETESRLAALERRGFVTRVRNDWEPTHDQIAEIAVESAPLAMVVASHSALGRVLASDAEFDQRLYPRAAHHLIAARDSTDLERLFGRWVDLARSRGDQRSAAALAHDLLGAEAEVGRVRRLVQTLPANRRTPGLPWRGAVAALSLLMIAFSVTFAALDEPPPPAVFAGVDLLAMQMGDGDTVRVLRSTLDPRSLGGGDPLALERMTRAGVFPGWSRVIGSPRLAPDGAHWAYAHATGDSGIADIFLVGPEGEQRLTAAEGYDASPAWSPDSRQLAFVSRRWTRSEAGEGDGDIAVIDVASGSVRQLTRGPGDDHSPSWSPDGSRIAFARRHAGPVEDETCWVTGDGRRERCVPQPVTLLGVLAWQGPAHLLVLAESEEEELIARVAADGGAMDVLVRGPMSSAAASADGLWVACLCRRGGDPAPAWYVFAAGAPQVARQVLLPEGAEPVMLDWGRVPGDDRHVTEFAIENPDRPITADATYRLRWSARGPAGNQIQVPESVLRWQSGDTTIATMDSVRGVVRPRGVGTVTIFASAGGWAQDSIELSITAPRPRTRLQEGWTDAAAPSWKSFGTPAPNLVLHDGRGALRVHGDGSFRSGVYSLEEFEAVSGVGMETRIAQPSDTTHRQDVTIALTSALDAAALAGWDHVTGDPPGNHLEPLRSCSVAYPGSGAGTARRFAFNAAATSSRLHDPPSPAGDGWHTVRIQIFSDGTCGVAIDGVPVWRSDASLATSPRYRIQISARSESAPLVGFLEVWDGVRGGLDWTVLE